MLALLTTGESGESASEARVNQLPLATRSVLGPGFCRWQRGGLRGLPLAMFARRQLTPGAIGGADGSQPSNCPRIGMFLSSCPASNEAGIVGDAHSALPMAMRCFEWFCHRH